MDAPSVLAVDDDSGILELIQETLAAEGMNVIVAVDGTAGVELLQTRLPDVVLCDVVMPGVDGHGVLAALRSHSLTAAIPLIFLTAESARSHQRLGMEEGADDYLTKPFNPEELVRAVRAQLEKREAVRRRTEQQLDELRSSISQILPHELLTPLTPILAYAGMLRESPESFAANDLVEMGSGIEQAAQRLERTVRNVLFYAELEILRRDPAAVALLRTARSPSVAMPFESGARRAAARSGREDDLKLAIDELPVAMPKDHLGKIGEELTDNACKFSAPGSPIAVHGHRDGDSVKLSVTDHGQGMAPAEIKRIGAYLQFNRKQFEQQGSGLGLVIVKRAAELAGGRFALASVLGRGTVADVRIPLAD